MSISQLIIIYCLSDKNMKKIKILAYCEQQKCFVDVTAIQIFSKVLASTDSGVVTNGDF